MKKVSTFMHEINPCREFLTNKSETLMLYYLSKLNRKKTPVNHRAFLILNSIFELLFSSYVTDLKMFVSHSLFLFLACR